MMVSVYVALCVDFFFFKQKTAYDMRISDWSSDVCSSDLNSSGLRLCSATGAMMICRMSARVRAGDPMRPSSTNSADRKSVVKGKSVSVRVDLGGRRNIKKNIHNVQNTTASSE